MTMPRGRLKACVAAATLFATLATGACAPDLDAESDVEIAVGAVTAAGSLVKETELAGLQASMVESVALERLPGLDPAIDDRGRVVTVARTGTGVNLSLWRLFDSGGLTRVSSLDLAGNITRASVAALGAGGVVVALSDGQDVALRLYQVTVTDQLVFRASATILNYNSAVVARVAQGNTNPHQIVVAGRDLNGSLKLVAFRISSSVGPFTKLAETGGVQPVSQVAIAPLPSPRGLFTTPVIRSNGLAEVRAWMLTAAGTLTARGVLSTDDPTARNELAATALSHGRVATVSRSAAGATRLALYNVSGTGTITLHHAVAVPSALSRAALVNGGGGRLFLAGKSSAGAFLLESWEAIDQLRNIDVQAAGPVGASARPIGLATVRGDRVVAAVSDPTGLLKVAAWRDYNVPLVRGAWPVTLGSPTGAPPPASTATTFNFLPFTQDEPAVTIAAAAQSFVVVSGSGQIAFFDKAGSPLPLKNAGVPTQLTYDQLFAPIINHRNPDGTVNQQSLRRHLEFQSLCDPEQPIDGLNRCPGAVTDANVVFDLSFKRFVISANLLYLSAGSDLFSRHALLAVSKTEDPRDGFHLFGNTESMVRSEPRLGVSAGMATLAYAGTEDSVLRPTAYLYDLVTLSQNAATVNVTKLTTTQTRVGLRPLLQHFGSQPAGFVTAADYFALYAYQKDTRGAVFVRASSLDAGGMPMQGRPLPTAKLALSGTGTYSGHLYFPGVSSGNTATGARVPQIMRIPITWSASSLALGDFQRIDYDCPGMFSGQAFSCEYTSATVNGLDNVLVSYARVMKGSDPDPAGWSSARFTFFPTFDKTTITDAVLRQGEGPVATQFSLGYTQTVPDPAGVGFWTAHKYATSAGIHRWVAGRVVQ